MEAAPAAVEDEGGGGGSLRDIRRQLHQLKVGCDASDSGMRRAYRTAAWPVGAKTQGGARFGAFTSPCAHSRGKGKQSKDASGKEICYSWGFRQGSCKGDNPCPNNRAHRCQWCLSTQHRTMDCTQHR